MIHSATGQRCPLVAILAVLGGGCEAMAPTPAVSPSPSPPSAEAPPSQPPAAAPPLFGIGGGETDVHTHISFETPRRMIGASVRVVVDRVAPVGLNFFALQVDFANATWAHGGVQDVDGPDGTRTRQVNWGGLVDRGGGNADYDEMDDVADLGRIQNPAVGRHVGPYAWQTGVAYDYVLERGARVTLPPGDYHLLPDRPRVHVAHPRTMWEWRFTVRPVTGDGAPYVAVLYDAADSFTSFYVWNESGYGSTDAAQHTSWWAPQYVAADGPAAPQAPAAWDRF